MGAVGSLAVVQAMEKAYLKQGNMLAWLDPEGGGRTVQEEEEGQQEERTVQGVLNLSDVGLRMASRSKRNSRFSVLLGAAVKGGGRGNANDEAVDSLARMLWASPSAAAVSSSALPLSTSAAVSPNTIPTSTIGAGQSASSHASRSSSSSSRPLFHSLLLGNNDLTAHAVFVLFHQVFRNSIGVCFYL